MRRGTTPVHIFTPDIDLTGVTVLYVTYEQNNTVILEKTINDVELSDNTIRVQLTQAETLLFDSSRTIEIQIRIKYSDGSALASNIVKTTADKILKDGEI